MRIGILAYGSLIADPGKELQPFIETVIDGVVTPFAVEFARSSSSRDGAPTLIPVDSGGALVKGKILVLNSTIDLDHVKTLLWRRETRNEFSTKRYIHPTKPGTNHVLVESISDRADLDTVLFTRIGSNIERPTAERLATLAICSARAEAGAKGEDGISYLSTVVSHGIATPLVPAYRDTILRQTGARDLEEAHRRVRLTAAIHQASCGTL